jgi:hypothetical protein
MLSLGNGSSGLASAKERTQRPRLEIRLDRDGSWFDSKRGGWALQGDVIRHGTGNGTASLGLSFRSIADSGQGEPWRITSLELIGAQHNLSMDDSDSRRVVFSTDSGFSSIHFRCLVTPPKGVDPAMTGFRQGG